MNLNGFIINFLVFWKTSDLKLMEFIVLKVLFMDVGLMLRTFSNLLTSVMPEGEKIWGGQ